MEADAARLSTSVPAAPAVAPSPPKAPPAMLLWLAEEQHVTIMEHLRPDRRVDKDDVSHCFPRLCSTNEHCATNIQSLWREFHSASMVCRDLAAAAARVLDDLRRECLSLGIPAHLPYCSALMRGRIHWGRIHFTLTVLNEAPWGSSTGVVPWNEILYRDDEELAFPFQWPGTFRGDDWRRLTAGTHHTMLDFAGVMRHETVLGDASSKFFAQLSALLLCWCLHFDRGGRNLPREAGASMYSEGAVPYWLPYGGTQGHLDDSCVEPHDSLNHVIRELSIAAPTIFGHFEIWWLTRGSPWLWPEDRLDDPLRVAGHVHVMQGFDRKYRADPAEDGAICIGAMQAEFGALRDEIEFTERPYDHFVGSLYSYNRCKGNKGKLPAEASMQLVRALLRTDREEALQVLDYFLRTQSCGELQSTVLKNPDDDDETRHSSHVAACYAMYACVCEDEGRLDDAARILRTARDHRSCKPWSCLELDPCRLPHGKSNGSFLSEQLYSMWETTSETPFAWFPSTTVAELLQAFPALSEEGIGLPAVRPPWLAFGALDRCWGRAPPQPCGLKSEVARLFLRFDEEAIALRRGSEAFNNSSFIGLEPGWPELQPPRMQKDEAMEAWCRVGMLYVHHYLCGAQPAADGTVSYRVLSQTLQPCDSGGDDFTAKGDEARLEHFTRQQAYREAHPDDCRNHWGYHLRSARRRDAGFGDVCQMEVVGETIEMVASSRLRTLQAKLPDDDVAIQVKLAQRGCWQRGLVYDTSRQDTLTLVLTKEDVISRELHELLCRERDKREREAQAANAANRAAVAVYASAAREKVMMAAAKAAEVAAIKAAATATRIFENLGGKRRREATLYPLERDAGGWHGENIRTSCAARIAHRDACKAAQSMFATTIHVPMTIADEKRRAAAAQRAASIAYTEELGRCLYGTGREAVAVLNMRWPAGEWKVATSEARNHLMGCGPPEWAGR